MDTAIFDTDKYTSGVVLNSVSAVNTHAHNGSAHRYKLQITLDWKDYSGYVYSMN